MQKIHELKNGLTLIIEEMPQFQSVAYDLSIPGGIISDSPEAIGASLLLGELTSKGAGQYDAKGLSEAFDEYGIRHGEGAGHDRFSYRGSLIEEYLPRALELVSLMVTKPHLPEAEIDNIRSLFLQDLHSLNDSPSRKAMVLLSEKYFPSPYSRSSMGTVEGLNASDHAHLTAKWKEQFRPRGSVLSIAGNVKTEKIVELVEKLFSGWEGTAVKKPAYSSFPSLDVYHEHTQSAQLQIVLAYPSAKFGDPDYYTAKVANQLLSGGMFGRLFIEVREKRGLCYSVYARHAATQDYGIVQAYAGTTPERAHETLEVMLGELSRLKGSVEPEEMARAKSNLKSALIIGDESPGARASSNSTDWWINKRLRTLDEIISEINKVQISDIDAYVSKHPPTSYTLLTLGSRDLRDFYKRVIA